MYTTYNTEALFIEKKIKDKDALLLVFTKDLGLLYVFAIGVLKEKAKLKHLIEPGSLATVSLIKGKNRWILKGVENHKKILKDFQSQAVFFRFVKNLIPQEQKEEELFEYLIKILSSPMQSREIILNKMLKILGYSNKSTEELLSLPEKNRLEVIQKLLQETQIINDIL